MKRDARLRHRSCRAREVSEDRLPPNVVSSRRNITYIYFPQIPSYTWPLFLIALYLYPIFHGYVALGFGHPIYTSLDTTLVFDARCPSEHQNYSKG